MRRIREVEGGGSPEAGEAADVAVPADKRPVGLSHHKLMAEDTLQLLGQNVLHSVLFFVLFFLIRIYLPPLVG